jgi:hypothetical protein
LLRARGARGRRDSLLQDADAPHQSDTRSDSSKKRAEDDRGKGKKGERDREKGNKGDSKRAKQREKICITIRKRQTPPRKHIILTLLNFRVFELSSIRLLRLVFQNSPKAVFLQNCEFLKIHTFSFMANLQKLKTRSAGNEKSAKYQKIDKIHEFLDWQNMNIRTSTSKSCSSDKLEIRKEQRVNT